MDGSEWAGPAPLLRDSEGPPLLPLSPLAAALGLHLTSGPGSTGSQEGLLSKARALWFGLEVGRTVFPEWRSLPSRPSLDCRGEVLCVFHCSGEGPAWTFSGAMELHVAWGCFESVSLGWHSLWTGYSPNPDPALKVPLCPTFHNLGRFVLDCFSTFEKR